MRGFGRRCARAGLWALALMLALPLASCAPAPVAMWSPPSVTPVPGVTLVLADGPNSPSDEAETPSGETPDTVAAAPETGLLGLRPGRLRNDDFALAARFAYVPGVPAFNAWVNERLWAEIGAIGAGYAPQAHGIDAGLSDRGCIAGSASWPAPEVLSRPETAPPGGTGTAITCDITAAFGSLIEFRLRTVVGSAEAVTRDELSLVYIDVENGTFFEPPTRWNATAAAEVWFATVELLRHAAGSLSTAALAAPDEAQLALATAALDQAQTLENGELLVTMPPGLASPELARLGIEASTAPTEILVDPTKAATLTSAEFQALHADLGTPFIGIASAASSVPIDCGLIACVALTYDDGPSDFTAQLLDTLAAHQARATFFMVGGYAVNRPELVARVTAEGHEVASHTMNHPDLTTLPLGEARAQVLNAGEILSNITGQPNTMFRPPFGAINSEVIAAVGLPAILWSIDTNDWRRPGQDALFERAALGARVGDIILFHDTHLDTVQAADAIIRGLRDRGFEPVTVTQLFGGQVPGGRVSRA